MLIARGNVALATVFNAVNTALAPLLVPGLFLLYTGITLQVPAAALMAELAARPSPRRSTPQATGRGARPGRR